MHRDGYSIDAVGQVRLKEVQFGLLKSDPNWNEVLME
jgi:hypothetical protein